MIIIKHLGDITKINGAEIEPVDCITAGSPCQDLSVAGKRAGLEGERSGLFMEQIRIIKEMRKADEQRGRTDEFIRPRYMVWENVPGALSSNKGEDFRASLKRQQGSSKRMPIYLDLRKVGGHTPDVLWAMGGPLLGEYTMHSFGEFPKEENASLLSQILVEEAHPKYSLSAKACQGILNRANRRGKKLPEILQKALESQANEN